MMSHRLVSGTIAFLLFLNSLAPSAFAFPRLDTDQLRPMPTEGTDAERRLTDDLRGPQSRPPARGSVPGVFSFFTNHPGPLTRGEIARGLGLSQRTIAPDLAALTNLGLVTTSGQGAAATYKAVEEAVAEQDVVARIQEVLERHFPYADVKRDSNPDRARAEIAEVLADQRRRATIQSIVAEIERNPALRRVLVSYARNEWHLPNEAALRKRLTEELADLGIPPESVDIYRRRALETLIAEQGAGRASGSVPGVFSFLVSRSVPMTKTELADGLNRTLRTIDVDLAELREIGLITLSGKGIEAVVTLADWVVQADSDTLISVHDALAQAYRRVDVLAEVRLDYRKTAAQALAKIRAQSDAAQLAAAGQGGAGVGQAVTGPGAGRPVGFQVVAINDVAFNFERHGTQGLKDFVTLLEREFASAPRSQFARGGVAFDYGQDADGYWISINGARIAVTDRPDPATLPWGRLGVDLALEATGRFTSSDAASKHLEAGARKVIITAPATGEVQTIAPGVNQELLDPDQAILSCASCTTNAIAPPLKLLSDAFRIEKFYMATTHAYTADQALKDTLRPGAFLRGREAAENIIPTSTGAARAISEVIPELAGKGTGVALRVPVPNGSIAGITAVVSKATTKDEVNRILREAAAGPLRGIMAYTEEELVSRDILGRSESSIIAGNLTEVSDDGTLVTVWAWYDNEFGYANRVLDLVALIRWAAQDPEAEAAGEPVRVAINGAGRIGVNLIRGWLQRPRNIEAEDAAPSEAAPIPPPVQAFLEAQQPRLAQAIAAEVAARQYGPTPITILAQRIIEVAGARTGEVHIDAAIAAGATGVIIGHSETRAGSPTPIVDTHAQLNEQMRAAVERDAIRTIILAVGEQTEATDLARERTRDQTLRNQLSSALEGVPVEQLAGRLVVAYEPRWAIAGSGQGRPATPAYAQAAHRVIREALREQYGDRFASRVRIIYGGSATAENAADFLTQDDVDGLLPGGASTSTEKFVPLLQAVQAVAAQKQTQTGRRLFVAGNHKTYEVTESPEVFAAALGAIDPQLVEVAIAPTLTAITTWRMAFAQRDWSPGLPGPVQTFVQESAALTGASRIEVVDVSDRERLIAESIAAGDLIDLGDGTYYARSHPQDVARTEERTRVLTRDPADAGEYNRWKPTDEYRPMVVDAMRGESQGQTMYVAPYLMSPPGTPLEKPAIGVELTDNRNVALNAFIMFRTGDVAREALGDGSVFERGLHVAGDLNAIRRGNPTIGFSDEVDERHFYTIPDDREMLHYGSAYGGNALLGKIGHGLRQASYDAHKGFGLGGVHWLAEQMGLMEIVIEDAASGEEIERYGAVVAAPSGSGKTNLVMLDKVLEVELDGRLVRVRANLLGDDISWIWEGPDGQLRAFNPENGVFGIAPGTNGRTNASAMAAIGSGSGTIFTNTGINEEQRRVFWEGLEPADRDWIEWVDDERKVGYPKDITGWRDWQGKLISERPVEQQRNPAYPWAHPNSRFTTSLTNFPNLSPRWNSPDGIPIHMVILGGRSQTDPLIREARDLAEGVYEGFVMGVEATAAAEGKAGEFREDPMSMRPFFGPDEEAYLENWFDVMGRAEAKGKAPKMFRVNWFRKDKDGKFIWPGYGENLRALLWAIERIKGQGKFVETPVGNVPTPDAIHLGGSTITEDQIAQLTSLDPEALAWDVERRGKHLDKFPLLPEPIRQAHERVVVEEGLWQIGTAAYTRLGEVDRLTIDPIIKEAKISARTAAKVLEVLAQIYLAELDREPAIARLTELGIDRGLADAWVTQASQRTMLAGSARSEVSEGERRLALVGELADILEEYLHYEGFGIESRDENIRFVDPNDLAQRHGINLKDVEVLLRSLGAKKARDRYIFSMTDQEAISRLDELGKAWAEAARGLRSITGAQEVPEAELMDVSASDVAVDFADAVLSAEEPRRSR